jgi:hypothetical protein
VRYEHDREGTVMVTETVKVTESRKRVSASSTAAVTPSRHADEDRVHGYFVREGHVSTAIKEREELDQRRKQLRIIEKLDAMDRRSKARKLKRTVRAATPAGRRAAIESEARSEVSDALTIMADHLRDRGSFIKYGQSLFENEWSSDEEAGEKIGDTVFSASSDSGLDFPLGEAPTRKGRKAQRRRSKLIKKQHRDAVLWSKLNLENWEYFDRQDQDDVRIEIIVTEEENFLLAHRGRLGEEECRANYRPCRGAPDAEPPPSPPPSAKVRKLENQEYDALVVEQSENSEEEAAQTTMDKVAEGGSHTRRSGGAPARRLSSAGSTLAKTRTIGAQPTSRGLLPTSRS